MNISDRVARCKGAERCNKGTRKVEVQKLLKVRYIIVSMAEVR